MSRSLTWLVVIAAAVGVGCVAVDAVQRASTLGTLAQGIGTPDNPTNEAVREATLNLVYLLGLAVGAVSGIAMAVAAGLWWRLVRTRA
ncbi:MAG: hypothetical protein FJ271_22320 [Planctomycetes bacterium]|nr:hypothetical protein [Planctomycetota bacterium]